eukprot:3193012-Pyramimonas_sp.AAC.2
MRGRGQCLHTITTHHAQPASAVIWTFRPGPSSGPPPALWLEAEHFCGTVDWRIGLIVHRGLNSIPGRSSSEHQSLVPTLECANPRELQSIA